MPFNRDKVEQWSLAYWLLKCHENFFFKLYFRTEIVGIEKLPDNATLIFAPNHQNTLMDALAILTLKRDFQPIFLARADIFKKPFLSKILTFLKIMPVYRSRDGFENLLLNDRIFQKTLDVLQNRNGLVVLPEGSHEGVKKLRQLKKGIARIAFQAEDAANGKLGIQIVPVGLEYSNYVAFRSNLLIRLGEPIEVDRYLELYRQNRAQAYNALIAELEQRMRLEMINIEDENYTAYLTILELFSARYIKERKLPKSQNQKFQVDKKIISLLDRLKNTNASEFEEIIKNANDYGRIISANGLSVKLLPASSKTLRDLPIRLLLLLITMPVALYGAVNNAIPIAVPYLLSKKFKDVQFHSSIKHAGALLLTPLAYLVQTLVVGFVLKNIWLALAYLATLPLGAAAFYLWRREFFRFTSQLSLRRFRKAKAEEFDLVNDLNNQIYRTVTGLVNKE
ncbi:MAG: hypothetical protein GX439_04085 [Bacteroidales bacterium]|nr:hypothetical protein [Bacteroidales bacterium]